MQIIVCLCQVYYIKPQNNRIEIEGDYCIISEKSNNYIVNYSIAYLSNNLFLSTMVTLVKAPFCFSGNNMGIYFLIVILIDQKKLDKLIK